MKILINIVFGEIEEGFKVRKSGSLCLWFPTFRDVVKEGQNLF